MPSIPAVVMHGLLKARMEKFNNTVRCAATLEEQVTAYRRELAIDAGSLVLGDCRAEDAVLAGRPVTWIFRDDFPSDRVILYFHGGGYVGGTLYHNRNTTSDIARAAGLKVVGLDYRLAPEFPFPAALEDALDAYKALLAEGYLAGAITLMGSSAGGGLALATALVIRDAGLALPGAVVGLSPWCDLTMQQITVQANNGKDIMLTSDFLEMAAELYTAGHDPADPMVSPLYGDMTGLPPLLLQVASEELLLGEVVALADKARKCGVVVELEIFDGMWHVWQSMSELVPEARTALEKVGKFVARHTGPASPEILPVPEIKVVPVAKKYGKPSTGLIHIHCGDGQGKTSAAVGLILRAAGHGRRIMLVQFLKNGRSGELAAMRSIPGIHVLAGPANTLFTNMMDARQKEAATEQHQRHLALAARAAKAEQLDMLVLDEVLDAVQTGLLPESELLAFLRDKPPALEVLLTGRYPSDAMLATADYISDIRCVRHPWDQGIKAREGVEY